jgi:restriction-modification enzyme MmeI-like protein
MPRPKGHTGRTQRVAHFLDKLLFCIFAQDAGLLPAGLLERLAEGSRRNPEVFTTALADLFATMSEGGGLFGAEPIDWFNGGLFDSADVLPLTAAEIGLVQRVSRLDWSQVEPAVFGTLFERGLDPGKRAQLGAHYTDRQSIMRVIEPVLMVPLRRDFEATKQRVQELLAEGRRITARTPPDRNPQAVFNAFLARLRAVRVLDPACGSGNFCTWRFKRSRTWSATRSCGPR